MLPMLACLLLFIGVPPGLGSRLTIDIGKQAPPKNTELPDKFSHEEPSTWMSPTGTSFERDVIEWVQFANKGEMPRAFTNLFQRLQEEGNGEESEFLENAWQTGDLKGLYLSIPAGTASQHDVVLEKGDTLLFAYRVQEKDVLFEIDVMRTVMDLDMFASQPIRYQSKVFSEKVFSTDSAIVGFWKPPPSRFADIESSLTKFGIEQSQFDTIDHDHNGSLEVPACTVDLVWDNGYSWLNPKKVVAMVGILKRSVASEPQVQNWSGFWTNPFTMSNYSLGFSQTNLFLPTITDYAEGHPLDKSQCDEAKTRVAEKTGFEKDMALLGYLLEVGLKTTKALKASVEAAIDSDCDITAADLTLSSNANFLTQSECQQARALAGSKEGEELKFELRKFLKEKNRNPSEEMIKRATEQISADCVPASEQRLSAAQCLGMNMFAQSVTGPAKQVEAIKIGLRSFGMPEYQHLVAEVCKQMAEGCGQNPSEAQVENVVMNQAPQKTEKKPLTLTAEECRRAQEAIDGKESMYVRFHLQTWLYKNGKEYDMQAANTVLEELQAECGASHEKQPIQSNQNMLVEEVSQAAAEDVLVEKPPVKDSEKPGAVSSGTIRRQDFVQDERFGKYRMMKKLNIPKASVESKMTMEKADLLQSGLTEEDLKCFVLLLFGEVDECNAAPKGGSTKMLDQSFLSDKRMKKYKMMHQIGQTREMVENKLTMDKAALLNQGLTEAELDCFKKLLFDGVESCDASPAGKVLGPEFVDTDNKFFKKYKMMHKLKQTKNMILNKIATDKAELKALGFTDTEMNCFVQLLFQETTKCVCGPAQREENTSKEAKSLALAKTTQENLASLLDGDKGLLPAVLPSLGWATDVFEAVIPKTGATQVKKVEEKTTDSKKLENFLDGKIQQDVNIMLARFPKTGPVDTQTGKHTPVVWRTILEEIAQGEFTFARSTDTKPLKEDLETVSRALHRIPDSEVENVKPHTSKITDKHDLAHQFTKALVPFLGKEGASLRDISDCIDSTKSFGDKFGVSLRGRLDSLSNLQKDYKHVRALASTLATAGGGFIVQLLSARMAITDSSTANAKQSIDLYEGILRAFRQKAGFSDGDETVAAVVPLLALFNVVVDTSKRLRPTLVQKNPELAQRLSPTYIKLFSTYIQQVVAEEERQDVQDDAEELLTCTQCEQLKEAMAAASKDMFKEVALQGFLRTLKKLDKINQVKELVKKPCARPVVVGPLSSEQCEEALKIVKSTPDLLFQKIELEGYYKEKGVLDQRDKAHAQVQGCCHSGKPEEPTYKISTLFDQCIVVLSLPKPSSENSVRGAAAGVAKTKASVKRCLSAMPVLQQGEFQDLMDEAEVVLDKSKQLQDTVFEVMIQSSGPFLPHDSKGNVDKKVLWDLVKKLPEAGQQDDAKRIRGESTLPTYTVSDILDDEALRYATHKFCSELVVKDEKTRKWRWV